VRWLAGRLLSQRDRGKEMKRITAALAIATMVCGSAAWADKPVQYPVGPDQVTGFFVADCGDFFVLSDFRSEGYARDHFNSDGSLNRTFFNLQYPDGIYYNANDPSYWLAGKAEHTQQWMYFQNGMATKFVEVGPVFKVTVPGYGVVFHATGRKIWEYNQDLGQWENTWGAGPSDYLEGNSDALCAALRP